MMRKKVYSENHWSDLVSQLGIDSSNTPDSQTTTDSTEISEIEISVPDQDQSPPLTEMNNSSEIVKETAFCPEPDAFGKGLLENVAEEVPPPAKKTDGKKRFFERFPKINLFGTVAKESLEAVVESVKSPSLSGKTFTSNKLEKISTVSDYASRNETEQKERTPVQNEKTSDRFDTEKVFSDVEGSPEKIICTEEHTQAIVDILDPWSKVASQIGALTVSPSLLNQEESEDLYLSDWLEVAEIADDETEKTIEQTEKNTEQSVRASRDFNKRGKYHDKRQSRKSLPSMFDEPMPESEESAALKNLMESEQYDNDAEKRLRSIFSEEEKAEWTTPNETTPKSQYSIDPPKQRGKYYGNIDNHSENQTATFSRRFDREEESFTVNEEHVDRVEEKPRELVRERGRRGTRFEPRETKQEQFSAKNNTDENRFGAASHSENVGATWDIEEESKPVERFPHKHRRGRNLENNSSSKEYSSNREYRTPSDEPTTNAFEPKPTTEEEMDMIQLHKNIPSWDEAIEQLIEHNIARRFQFSSPRNNSERR
ncbi:MAG: hypothetical protein LBF88_01790 [Planctomycetaceae bacterium]|jgi:hypothetical protein|nr:hypothetical protein [Planctomycetaceae bacterium]